MPCNCVLSIFVIVCGFQAYLEGESEKGVGGGREVKVEGSYGVFQMKIR